MVRFKWSKVDTGHKWTRDWDRTLCRGLSIFEIELTLDPVELIYVDISVRTTLLQSYVPLKHISRMSLCVNGYIRANL